MLTPKQIVDALDRYIVGQEDAKKAVAVALRNRYRRSRLPEELRCEITPKNIIMCGPTGVGKTEIARRLAKLVDAPFIKVEATKFTEVGYVGRDVESIVRDLVDESIRICKAKRAEQIRTVAEAAAEQRLCDLAEPGAKRRKPQVNPLQLLLGGGEAHTDEPQPTEEERSKRLNERQQLLQRLRNGELEDMQVEIEVEEASSGMIVGVGMELNIQDVLGDIMPKKRKLRKATVAEARRILIQQETDKRIDMDSVYREALANAEQEGIVFIDEIDKIVGTSTQSSGPEVSREGVQRDILPIVEGSMVSTKYGPVKTDYMLFIAAGAFHVSKVTDLIPELQGRFPITVKLNDLTEEDFKTILTQPDNALIKQYAALLEVDNVHLSFTDDALAAIAKFAYLENETGENIGARRLHSVVENLLDDISFNATGEHPKVDMKIDAAYVNTHMQSQLSERDLKRYIL